MERAAAWRRLLASGIDVISMYCWALFFAMSCSGSQWVCLAGAYGGVLAYSLVELIFKRSPGKLILHLCITRENGARAMLRRRVARWIVRQSPILFLALGTALQIEDFPRSYVDVTDLLMWSTGIILFAGFVTSAAIGHRPFYDAMLRLDVSEIPVPIGGSQPQGKPGLSSN
jgi:hypothetical protein